MKIYDYDFIGSVSRQVDFGKRSIKQDVKFRETKAHYIREDGTKFNKETWQSLSGHKYKGHFFGEKIESIAKITHQYQQVFLIYST